MSPGRWMSTRACASCSCASVSPVTTRHRSRESSSGGRMRRRGFGPRAIRVRARTPAASRPGGG
eukprot:4322339-Prymnesium_polylepis.1